MEFKPKRLYPTTYRMNKQEEIITILKQPDISERLRALSYFGWVYNENQYRYEWNFKDGTNWCWIQEEVICTFN